MRLFFILILSILFCNVLVAQVDKDGQPVSWSLESEIAPNTQFLELTPPDVEALLAEDILVNQCKDQPFRFASSIAVVIEPLNDGQWINRHNGDRVWMMGIRAEGALSLGVTFGNLSIPKGAYLYIYNSSRSDFIGPINSSNNKSNQPMGTIPVYGDEIVVEYFEPFEVRGDGQFTISSVAFGYRDVSGDNDDQPCLISFTASGNSLVETASSSVQLMLVDNCTRVVSGVLLNNTSNNGTPYFLTTHTADYGNPESWLFVFNVNQQQCDGTLNCWGRSLSGAKMLLHDEESNIALLQLDELPPGKWNTFYSGWNFNADIGNEIYCMQYALAQPLSVSVSDNEPSAQWWEAKQKNALEVQSWQSGMTFPGSAGSPLFNSQGHVVSTFLGGNNNCRGWGKDYFSDMSECWEQLEPYLDPKRKGSKTHDGFFPSNAIRPDSKEVVMLFPNPANALVNVNFNGEESLLRVLIFDQTGRQVKNISPQFPQFQVNELGSGIYSVSLVFETFVHHKTLVVK
ncbi:MAG: T9SS type A sorting domain-containing protein [Flavobacteriales bacterium]|nr:T9SS type A sorting domain-containing protein [Flavobacteriales bacterium]